MTIITTSKGDFVLIEVSKDLKLFTAILPHLNVTFLCTTDTITEEIAKGIVDRDEFGYYKDYQDYCDFCVLSITSFKTLLKSHNLSPDKTYAICKKVN